MGGFLLRVRTWWETADRTQKAVTLFGSLFLVLLLGGTYYFASRPHMAIVFSGLDSQEVGSVTDAIQKLGIPVEYDVSGNVQVPSDKVAEVRAKLALAQKLPSSGHMFSEDLNNISPLSTPSITDERLKSIHEDELAQSIEFIHGVQKARVQIAPAESSPFAAEQKPASASVFISPQPGAAITPDQGHAIAMLVSSAVADLPVDKVYVVDNNGHPLFDGTNNTSAFGTANNYMEARAAETSRQESVLQQKLDSAFGRGTTIVTVNLDLDFDKKTTDTTTHPQSEAIVEKVSQNESMTGAAGAGVGGIAGAASNTGTGAPAAVVPGTNKGYSGTSTDTSYPINTTQVHDEPAMGTVKTMAISTLVSDKLGVDGAANVGKFIDAYLASEKNVDAKAFTHSETQVAFDTTAAAEAKQSAQAAATQSKLQQALSFLPIAMLIFVGVMVMRAISKAAKTQNFVVGALPGGGTMALQGAASSEPDGQAPLEQGEHGGAPALEQQLSIEDIGSIQEKLNLPLEQLKRMSDEKPENVAMLIKSWLLEDHR